MKAIVCERLGPPEQLVVGDLPKPEVRKGMVRIAVHASSVNFPDTLIIEGKYQFKPECPFSPGGEVAGIVDAVGEGVQGLAVGTRVLAMTGWGGMADYVLAPAHQVAPIPDAMPYEVGASFIFTYGTSHHALRQRAQLQPGESVLVLGAAGGVGLAAVDLAKAMGARVIAAASTEEKCALAREYGADHVINYTSDDLRAKIKDVTGGNGVDVVYDPVGGDFAEPAFRSIGWKGRYLVVGFTAGSIPALPLNLPLLKGASVVGVFWGGFVAREPDVHLANVAELMDWYATGKIRPHVSRVYDFQHAPQAIRDMADRKALGKLVVQVAG